VTSHKTSTYLITDGSLTAQNFQYQSLKLLQILKTAVSSEVSMIQIREKQLTPRLIAALTSQMVRIARNSQTKVLVNDRADLALAAGANGVHLTSNSIPTRIVRQNFPENFIIGVSAHSLPKVREAKCDGADFVTFSPIFETASKIKYGAPQGLEKLSEVVEKEKDFPIVALGGIDGDNWIDALQTGAKGIAGISLFSEAEKLSEVIKKINNWSQAG
jgi:thiamine-phosphate pyrophosphorylase